MITARGLLAVAGGLVAGYGALLLVTTVPPSSLLRVAVWMATAVIIHDMIWSPSLLGLGTALARVPARGRRFLQGGLVVAGCLVVIAVPLISRQGSQPRSTTILLQDVGRQLAVLLALVALVTLIAWLRQALRDRRRGVLSSTGRSEDGTRSQ
jgi:hypothetical protein